jgi:hypothetical protein
MNTAPATSPSIQPWAVLSIKLITIAILALFLWPVPAMVTHISPESALVLGRYTPKYFASVAAYLSGTAIWAGLTVWVLGRLTKPRLIQIRHYIEKHLVLMLGALTLLTIGTVTIRSGTLAGWLVFPSTFVKVMGVIPSLFLVMVFTLAALIVDRRIVQQTELKLAEISQRPKTWVQSHPRLQSTLSLMHIDLLIVFAVLVGNLISVVIARGRYWSYPLTLDPSVDIYLGQHVLNGGVPYQTAVYVHPPLRFTISLLWNLGARITGLPPFHFVRALEFGIGVGILAVSYAMGRELTGRPVGGLLAAIIMLGTEHLQQMLIAGPTLRTTTTLLMIAGLWMGQRRRWFWAGALVTASALTLSPIGVTLIAVVLSALLQKGQPRWKAALAATGGGLLVIGLTATSLALQGVLDDAYRQTVFSVWLHLAKRYIEPQPGEVGAGFIQKLPYYYMVYKWLFRGDWELVALIALGPLVMLATRGVREVFRSPKSSVLLIASLLVAASTPSHFDGNVRDSVLLLAVVTPFGAEALIGLLAVLPRRLEISLPHLRGALEWAAVGVILVCGLPDGARQAHFLYSLVRIPLSEQQQMAEQLDAALQPEQTVQAVGNLWFLTFTNRDNASPFMEWDPDGIKAVEAGGWSFEEMVREIEAQEPVVVMSWPGPLPDEVSEWLGDNYTYVGQLSLADDDKSQRIFVRKGHDEVRAIVEAWPLVKRGNPKESAP